MITVNDISVQFGGTTFSDVSFAINENDKIALMGKMEQESQRFSRLLPSKPSTGNISAPKEAVVAYLPQHLLATDGATVMEEASKAFGEILNESRYRRNQRAIDDTY
jgi:ATP-binding cassette subfamily F protein 3